MVIFFLPHFVFCLDLPDFYHVEEENSLVKKSLYFFSGLGNYFGEISMHMARFLPYKCHFILS